MALAVAARAALTRLSRCPHRVVGGVVGVVQHPDRKGSPATYQTEKCCPTKDKTVESMHCNGDVMWSKQLYMLRENTSAGHARRGDGTPTGLPACAYTIRSRAAHKCHWQWLLFMGAVMGACGVRGPLHSKKSKPRKPRAHGGWGPWSHPLLADTSAPM